ncbi:ribonuclease HII [Patescibacteria group bacterium]|nr:ribonuclease HII [Patescibacteria group bacterium]
MNQYYKYLIGVDEVGRGPIAGPVTVCAFGVATDAREHIHEHLAGITDSKKLTEKKRNEFTERIKQLRDAGDVYVSISSVSASDIDAHGIVPCLKKATEGALRGLGLATDDCYVYLDGSLVAPDAYAQETIVKGDQTNWLISAASVVAKVTRDALMTEYGVQYPQYGFEHHKGYGTKAHYAAIQKYGLHKLHRKSWIKRV